MIRPWIWRFLNKRTSNRYNLLINTDKKQAHAQTLYEKKLLTYKSLCFTSIKDRHGVYAMINKDERRDVSIRKPRPSIRKQLADSKQATSPKKAAARTKKNELEV